MSRTPDPRAERLLEDVRENPELEGALRSAYRGRHDVVDALWWAAHPLSTSPRGVADPAAGLRDLQRAVFSRTTADSPMVEVTDPETGATLQVRESEQRLRQEERVLHEDAQHLADAMNAVGIAAAPSAQPTPETAHQQEPDGPLAFIEASAGRTTPPSGPDDESWSVDASENENPAVVSTSPRRKVVLPALAGMGLLSVILLLPTLTELNAGAGGDPSPSLTAAPRVTTEIVTMGAAGNVTDPMAILDRPQVEADRPPAGFPTSNPIDSFRALPDMVPYLRLYLTRTDDPDYLCLVAIQPDDLGTSGCVQESDFLANGLQLSGGRYAIDDNMTILTESYSLLSSGELRYDATARVRGGLGAPVEGSPEGELIEDGG